MTNWVRGSQTTPTNWVGVSQTTEGPGGFPPPAELHLHNLTCLPGEEHVAS